MFDQILVTFNILTLAFVAFMAIRQLKQGREAVEIVRETCAFLGMIFGEDHKKTIGMNAFVLVFLLAFNWMFDVPVYTVMWISIWAVAVVVAYIVRTITRVEFAHFDDYGFSVIQAFRKVHV